MNGAEKGILCVIQYKYHDITKNIVPEMIALEKISFDLNGFLPNNTYKIIRNATMGVVVTRPHNASVIAKPVRIAHLN